MNVQQYSLNFIAKLWFAAVLVGGNISFGASFALSPPEAANISTDDSPDEVSPGEDLMREHGVLRRILMIYDAALAQLPSHEQKAKAAIANGALLVQRFVHNYHEKTEETYLFPRFQRAGKFVALVDTLKKQHERGRSLTQQILTLSRKPVLSSLDKLKLAADIFAFGKMYRPHAAREDTEVFPAFQKLVGQAEYERLGDLFEKREHQLFGEDGFAKAVASVGAMERELQINNLAKFTPP